MSRERSSQHEETQSGDAPLESEAGAAEVVVVAAPAPEDEVAVASPRWGTATKSIVAVAALALMVLIIWRFRALLQPLILAAVIAYLLNPIVNWWSRRFRMERSTAVAIVYVGFIVLVLGLLGGLGFLAFNQADRLVSSLPTYAEQVTEWLTENWGRISSATGLDLSTSEQVDAIEPATIITQGLGWIRTTLTRGGSIAARTITGTISVLSTLFVIMFVAIYLSKDTPRLWASLADLATVPGYRTDAERLTRDFVRIWDSYLRGQVLLGLSMFFLVSLLLSILGVQYSLALGGLAGLLEFLPIIGPVVSTGVAVVVALAQDGNWLGLSPIWYGVLVLAVMLGLQQLEQMFLVPRFVGEALDLHPVVVIVVVLMGTSLAGVLGAVLAAPVAASAKLLGNYGWRKMFDLSPFPEDEPPDAPNAASVIFDWVRVRLTPPSAARPPVPPATPRPVPPRPVPPRPPVGEEPSAPPVDPDAPRA